MLLGISVGSPVPPIYPDLWARSVNAVMLQEEEEVQEVHFGIHGRRLEAHVLRITAHRFMGNDRNYV